MADADLLTNLKKPSFYPEKVKSVDIIQTHISYVALTGKYAYKIKKHVNFGFLDFSTLEKRKYFCEEELRLNRRLCPDIYLEVLPIMQENDDLKINGIGCVVDYTIKMREFSQEKIMANLLEKGELNNQLIDKICDILVDFYHSSEKNDEVDIFGNIKFIKKNIIENFEQTESMIDRTISKNIFYFIKNTSIDFIKQKKDLFEKRIQNDYIKDCHGDLHSGNIVISNNKIYIFDCIEFNKRFRYCDVASDISFLAMDLDYQNHQYLSSYLITRYISISDDKDILKLLNFYKCYRAYVRGKVIGFQLNNQDITKTERNIIIQKVKKYFDLSNYYASICSIDLKNKKSILFIVCGLTGTGKSTISSKISVDYRAQLINTDILRKQIEGIDRYERHHDEPDTGLYSPVKVDSTYKKVIEKASNYIKNGENVVLDATFQKKKYRDMVRKIAKENNAVFVLIECVCSEKITKKRLGERLKKKTVSDGRWEIYLKQKKTFEPLESDEKHIRFNMSDSSYDKRFFEFNKILSFINEAL